VKPVSHTLGSLLGPEVPPQWRDSPVSDIAMDARGLNRGGVFLACGGGARHGLEFLAQAREAGASAVAWEPAPGIKPPQEQALKCFPVRGLRKRLGELADRFFDRPSGELTVTGVTGTNGKTSCAWLLANAWETLGVGGAMMGTVGWGSPAALHCAELTTPDVVTVHRQLASLRAAGVHNVVMEVSSHALDQGRVDGVRFASALFTNLSRDHLDYHGDMHAYGSAKARLFQWSGLQMAAINVDDDFGARLFQSVPGRVRRIAISRQPGAQPDAASAWLAAPGIEARPTGLAMEIRSSWGAVALNSRLLGGFNASNVLLALAVLLDQGVDLQHAAAALESVSAPPGRMQALAKTDRTPLVIVDFAHTPDALEKALLAAREHCRGTLWCVFGAGGDRDRGKRPLMGGVVSRLADCVVITSDNPRHEDPAVIISDIRKGVQGAVPVEEFVDRSEAISWAVGRAGPRDVVLVAGKGHERYQQWGDERRPYSDQDCALAALEGRT